MRCALSSSPGASSLLWLLLLLLLLLPVSGGLWLPLPTERLPRPLSRPRCSGGDAVAAAACCRLRALTVGKGL